MTDDTALLRRFARERSESAFAELVQRQAGLVYSAALRQVGGDTQLAQDVSQSVFIDLARKASSLADRPELTSWLYTSTRFAALKALRAKYRRITREQQAHAMQENERDTLSEADWQQLRPILDAAICDLPEHDRSAVLMRYFEGQPFAAMGEKLGIGESSARMRAERALDKLRGVLAQKGITSTAAALGLVLSTQAVAAPPVGLAATLATGALAKSAAVGAGAGLFAKFSKFYAMNKIPSAFAAVTTLGAAGVATFETPEEARTTAFFVYAICFVVGLAFTLLSAVAGHALGGHGDMGHDFDVGHDHGGHAQGHAEGGGGAHDMPGFAPLGPTTISAFITAFGGFGMILNEFPFTHSIWISMPLATLGGFGVAFVVFLFFRSVFRRIQASSEGRVHDLIGAGATIITPIPLGGVGEIAYVQSGSRYSAPARAEDGGVFLNGASVTITRIVGTQFYVSAS